MMAHTEEDFMNELREIGEVKEDGDKLFISTIDSAKVVQVFRQHGMAFAISTSSVMKQKNLNNPRILWSFKEITYFGMPFKIRKVTSMVCKLAWSYKDPTRLIAKSPRVTSLPPGHKRLTMRITSKIGCPAKMRIVEVYVFPEYEVATYDVSSNGKRNLTTVQSKLMASLQSTIRAKKEVRKEARYFILVDKASVHNHPIWELTAPFFPIDGEEHRCQTLFDQAKSQNWVSTSDVKAPISSLTEWVSVVNSRGDLIRFFKEVGTDNLIDGLKVNDFVLIFFNDAQMDALREFGKKCICIDSHVLNAFKNVLLTSLTIVDDVKHGFPVAFMFSNRVNATVLEIFYQKVKLAFGGIVETDLLVSDIDEVYYNSWTSVMTPVKHVVYSAWSVEKDWCENLNLIADCAKESLAHKNLLALLEEPDESEFNVLFEDFCRWIIIDEKTREFGTYFVENFGSTAIRWAACCRQSFGIDFKRTLERSHSTLQQIIFQGKNVKSLRTSVQELMHFCMYKTFERFYPKRRIHALSETHLKSVARMKGLSLGKEGEEWVWKDSDQVVFRIAKFQPECRCIMKCVKCNGCAHMFICSCYWSSVYLNMCRHIHMLCDTLDLPSMYSALVENREKLIEAESNKGRELSSGASALNGLSEGDHSADRQSGDSSKMAAVSTGYPTRNGPSHDQFVEHRLRIASLMKDIQTRLNDADTQGEFEVVEELLQQVIPVADAHKAEAHSKVKVITLDGTADIPYYKTPEPVAKKRRVDVQLNRQHERIVIEKQSSPSIPETNHSAGMEMILGRQLAGSEEVIYGGEVVLECHELSEEESSIIDLSEQ